MNVVQTVNIRAKRYRVSASFWPLIGLPAVVAQMIRKLLKAYRLQPIYLPELAEAHPLLDQRGRDEAME